jgi:hypothetical protein
MWCVMFNTTLSSSSSSSSLFELLLLSSFDRGDEEEEGEALAAGALGAFSSLSMTMAENVTCRLSGMITLEEFDITGGKVTVSSGIM